MSGGGAASARRSAWSTFPGLVRLKMYLGFILPADAGRVTANLACL